MTKPVEDYVLTPESEGSEKKQILWNKWREGFKKNNKKLFDDDPDAANIALEEHMDDKRRRKLKQIDDRVEYNKVAKNDINIVGFKNTSDYGTYFEENGSDLDFDGHIEQT